MPIVNHFLRRLSVAELFERYVPHEDRRMKLAPAVALGVVVRNLVLHREPVYALGEWAAPFSPSVLGLGPGEASLLNDDRVGRALLRLFDADRASLMTALVLRAVAEFEVDCAELHNDSTSVTFSGAYRSATGAVRGGKATAPIAFGHNKDHRADLKQLVWILTVSADGAVPVAYRVEGGATNDDTTHVPTWDALVKLLGRTDFLYVADTKLANREAMAHIAGHGGRFVTVLPRTRKEDAFFRSWIQDHSPTWAEAARRPSRRPGEADNLWRTTPSPVPSAEGHRIVWVHSSLEAALDADSRQSRIQRAVSALSDLAARVSSPKSRWHTRTAVEAAAAREIASANAARWVSVAVQEHEEESFRQERRGRPGEETRYRRTTRTRFTLTWKVDTALVAYDAKSDGCFPLVTNDTGLSDAEVSRRLQVPAAPRAAPCTAEGRPARRPRLLEGRGAHRGTLVLPLRRAPRSGARRAPDPTRHGRERHRIDPPLPRRPRVRRAERTADLRDLQRPRPPRARQQQTDRADLRSRADAPPGPGARSPRGATQRLRRHVMKSTPGCAESEIRGCLSSPSAGAPRLLPRFRAV